MGRDKNAALAASMFETLCKKEGWTAEHAWKGIAVLLLSCKIWRDRWKNFHNVVVYRESNDFKMTKSGLPNSYLRRAEELTSYLASELGIDRSELCDAIGTYWQQPSISRLQPNNLMGHAFRSIIAQALQAFGDPRITYDEEVNPHREFPGYAFPTRSKDPRIDILARKGAKVVAIISTRWRFRHDRVDVPDEAMQYTAAARRLYPDCRFYAVVGEFAQSRLEKILDHSSGIHPHPTIDATVHFQSKLVTEGLREQGKLVFLKDLSWLINQTTSW